MRLRLVIAALVVSTPLATQEPAARRLAATLVPLNATLATVSGVRELHDGRLLLSDAKMAAVYIADAAGALHHIGSAGGDDTQYAQPGGFYAGIGDSILLLDRGLSKVLVIGPNGSIIGSRSIKRRGVTGSSSDDIDRQRIDAHGLAYFVIRRPFGFARPGGTVIDSVALVRFDAARQHADTVAMLREHETHVVQATEHMQMTQAVAGSPADDWGIASDGRVAVVRAAPYHVEWIAVDGHVTGGPAYTVPAIAYTTAERDSIIANAKSSSGSVGLAGGSGASTTEERHYYFADAKAPFAPNDVMVSPQGTVWVARTQPFGAGGTIYDVFNGEGARVDRVLLSGFARVVGFGSGVVYALSRNGGQVSLSKYKL